MLSHFKMVSPSQPYGIDESDICEGVKPPPFTGQGAVAGDLRC